MMESKSSMSKLVSASILEPKDELEEVFLMFKSKFSGFFGG